MRLQFEEEHEPGSQRYDAETLKKVTVLAQQLQSRHQETLTAGQIETIGKEVGLDPAFVREALARVTIKRAHKPEHGQQKRQAEASPSRLRALTRAWWAAAWSLIPMSMGLGELGPFGDMEPFFFFGSLGTYLGVGYYLNEIQKGAPEAGAAAPAGKARLSRTDLLEAMFSLQRELESHREHRAFLSVDVVGSSEMKLGGQALAVEYSFGRFQEWVEAVVGRHGGRVHSAAGDGAMCLFVTDADAVRAARELQQGIARFNAESNRLSAPFRIRCGLTAGEVAVDGTALGRIQSPIVDRAAQLQKVAEPGDIVVSAELASPALLELGTLGPLEVDRTGGAPAFSWRAGHRGSDPRG